MSWSRQRWHRASGIKALSSWLALLLVAAATACGSPQPEPTPEPSPLATPEPPIEASPSPTVAGSEPSPPVGSRPPPPTLLAELRSIAEVAEDVKPWVASITVETVYKGFFTDFTDEGAGSGIVVRSDGYVLTNNHVIAGARDIKVHLTNGESYDGRVVGRDSVSDLAMIKINARNLPTAKFATSDDLRVGDWVISMGNALALKGGPTLTVGIVSALGRTIETEVGQYFYDLIQTDAAMNDGSSGGPLVNLRGEVVGVNQAILRQAMGMAFAISAAQVVPIMDSLIEHGRVVRPQIGFNGDNVTSALSARFRLGVLDGVLVTAIRPGTPAYEAGIRLGDVVTKMDGIATPDVSTWLRLLRSYEVGDEVRVEYVRNGRVEATTVVLAELE